MTHHRFRNILMEEINKLKIETEIWLLFLKDQIIIE
jgi:hypothetical protein